MIQIAIGGATVTLQHKTEHQVKNQRQTSMTYQFDDVLHAVSRLAAATLSERDTKLVIESISAIRRELAARDKVDSPSPRS